VFAQTTHVVAAPHGFACVVIPATRLYIPSVIEIRSGVSEPRGVKIWPFPLLWLVAFTTACTTVQAVIVVCTCQYNANTHSVDNELIVQLCMLLLQLCVCGAVTDDRRIITHGTDRQTDSSQCSRSIRGLTAVTCARHTTMNLSLSLYSSSPLSHWV